MIKLHQYKIPGYESTPLLLNMRMETETDESKKTEVYMNSNLYSDSSTNDRLTFDFLRKYIYFAKNWVHPVYFAIY